MNWENITVEQFQEIYRLSINTSLDELDKLTRVMCILLDKTENEIDEMTVSQFNTLAKECAFVLTDKIPGKPEKCINIGIKKYAINYNPSKLRHRQYVEILHFSDKPIDNLHYLMASIVNPVKFGLRKKNKAEMHEAIARDMLKAKLIDVYHSCLFFCKLYVNSITVIRGYLEMEMTEKGMTKEQAKEAVSLSLNAMGGFIQQERWQSLNV